MTERLKKFGPLLVFIAAMIWASDAPFRSVLTQNLSSAAIVLAEHLINVVIVLPIIYFVRHDLKKLSPRQWVAVAIIGVGGSALAALAFTEAFNYMNPSVVILLQKFQPFIAVGLAAMLLKENLGKRFWWWVFLAVIGGYIISFPGFVPQVYEGEVFNPHVVGVLLALGAAVLWGASTVLGRYVLKSVRFTTMTAVRFVAGAIFLSLWSIGRGAYVELAAASARDIWFLIIIAVASGFISLLIYYRGLSQTKASIATFAELGFVVMAVVVNWIAIDAALKPMQIVGMVLVLFAVYQMSRLNTDTEQKHLAA